ncbi:DUF5994 family protein [Nocardioides sp. SYSU D00038]|uniref:DUF5994 family protein n=1 Tax=Nocardioides sp. SYSU D00038 TaxID=2812554 RepID=UPI0019677F03|nr:DUF5994 family protein [Nocardioides sp. SYSU D00038]
MPTPDGPTPPDATSREPLRLRLADHPGHDQLDGGWWPRSRRLEVELVSLLAGLPAAHGVVERVLCSPADWDDAPRSTTTGDRSVEVLPVLEDDPHVVEVETTDRVLRLLVVPPPFTADQGDEALLAAATRGNRHSAASLLDTVTEHPDVDPADHWHDDPRVG